jgi:hypothetical protein
MLKQSEIVTALALGGVVLVGYPLLYWNRSRSVGDNLLVAFVFAMVIVVFSILYDLIRRRRRGSRG